MATQLPIELKKYSTGVGPMSFPPSESGTSITAKWFLILASETKFLVLKTTLESAKWWGIIRKQSYKIIYYLPRKIISRKIYSLQLNVKVAKYKVSFYKKNAPVRAHFKNKVNFNT